MVLGGLLFVIYGYVHRGFSNPSSHKIQLTAEDLNQLEVYFVSQWRRSRPGPEFASLIEDRVAMKLSIARRSAWASIEIERHRRSAAWRRNKVPLRRHREGARSRLRQNSKRGTAGTAQRFMQRNR